MPRISRQRSESGYYHIMIRSNNKKAIFKSEEEKERLLDILTKKIDWCRVWSNSYYWDYAI